MRRPDHPRNSKGKVLHACGLAALSALLSGCFSTGEGLAPPDERIYFPVGLALDADASHLAVVSSDYDLQYNAGTMQVLYLGDPSAPDADVGVRRFVPRPCRSDSDCTASDASQTCDEGSGLCVDSSGSPCGPLAERGVSEQLLYPGPCAAIDPSRPPEGDPLLSSAVKIGAFATDVIYRSNPFDPAAPGRLFFPVRGDATLHWADLDADGRVDCGQDTNGGACDDRHRVGDDPDQENTRDLTMSAEPFAVDASANGRAIIVTHQTGRNVSLFRHDWAGGPELEFNLDGLGDRPVGVAAVPTPRAITERPIAEGDPNYGFLLTYRASPWVSLVRYVPDANSAPERPYLANAGNAPILTNSGGADSRGIAVDDSARRAAEEACFEQQADCLADAACLDAERAKLLACLDEAAAFGLDVYVANRSPETLLVGRTLPAVNASSSTELPTFYDTVSLPLGPSRVVVGDVVVGENAEGLLFERRVFVVCFDARRVVIYDPLRRRVDARVVTGRGPHALAIDSKHGLLFVGHFTDSYVGAVSIDRRFPHTYGTMLATIGTPTPPRASK